MGDLCDEKLIMLSVYICALLFLSIAFIKHEWLKQLIAAPLIGHTESI
jgi:hypothetical protein